MITYQISVNGQQYDVEIEDLDASPVQVLVNGKPFQVIVTDKGTTRTLAQSRPIDEPEIDVDAYVPAVSTTYQEIDIDDSEPSTASAAAPTQSPAEEAIAVSAPMPGTILDIAVQVGDRIGQGDTLCNLEAMKMKSPIRSPGEGVIAQVLISEGQNVGYGDVLFTLN